MFVYVGGDRVIDIRDVVAILDARRLQRAPDARALWLRAAEALDEAEAAAARALIVSRHGLLLVPITPATVARRVLERAQVRGAVKAEN